MYIAMDPSKIAASMIIFDCPVKRVGGDHCNSLINIQEPFITPAS
jgi:hypothetical protein